MNLFDVAWTDYLLLQADWPTEMGSRLTATLNPSRIIIHWWHEAGESFYLFAVPEIQARLRDAPPGQNIADALDLPKADAVAALEGSANAESAPYRAVVLAEGRPVGYIDAKMLADPTRRDPTRQYTSGSPEDTAVPQRYLQADLPDQLEIGTTVSLLVSISTALPARAPEVIDQPVGTTIDIVVAPKRGLILASKGEGSLSITDEFETAPLQIKLRAVDLGVGYILIYAFHEGLLVGRLTLQPTVIAALSDVADRSKRREVSLMQATARLPDLTLFIEEAVSDGRFAFTFRVTARDPDLDLAARKFASFVPQSDPGEFFRQFYEDIDDLPANTAGERQIAAQKLAGKGTYLYDRLIPAEVQSILAAERARIKSIAVLSEEPWVPWELCRPPDDNDTKGAFFSEAFAFSRWIPGSTSPRPHLKLQHIALVVPSRSGLAFASQERDFIQSLAGPTRQVTLIEPKFLPLSEALNSGKYDAWHFTGHGMFRFPDPDRSEIELDDWAFTPQDLTMHIHALRRTRPFVFMNGCQISQGGLSLTAMGGWAKEFIACGAGAFIAPLWSIYDRAALEFAKALYRIFLGGEPLAEAVRQARLEIRSEANPTTWLAYTVYGDPFAMV